jgi:hypothetical protein
MDSNDAEVDSNLVEMDSTLVEMDLNGAKVNYNTLLCAAADDRLFSD